MTNRKFEAEIGKNVGAKKKNQIMRKALEYDIKILNPNKVTSSG